MKLIFECLYADETRHHVMPNTATNRVFQRGFVGGNVVSMELDDDLTLLVNEGMNILNLPFNINASLLARKVTGQNVFIQGNVILIKRIH